MEDKIQHELDSLYSDMNGTRIRDGIKMQLYHQFKERVRVLAEMRREEMTQPKTKQPSLR